MGRVQSAKLRNQFSLTENKKGTEGVHKGACERKRSKGTFRKKAKFRTWAKTKTRMARNKKGELLGGHCILPGSKSGSLEEKCEVRTKKKNYPRSKTP